VVGWANEGRLRIEKGEGLRKGIYTAHGGYGVREYEERAQRRGGVAQGRMRNRVLKTRRHKPRSRQFDADSWRMQIA
jgi:hypothetical protein